MATLKDRLTAFKDTLGVKLNELHSLILNSTSGRIKTLTGVTGTLVVDLSEEFRLYKLTLTGNTNITFIGTEGDNYKVVGLEIKGGHNFTIEPNINYVGDLPLSDGLYQFQLVKNSPNWEANLFQVRTEPEVLTKSGYKVAAYEGVNVTHTGGYSAGVPFSNTVIDEDVLFTKTSSNYVLKANQAGYYKINLSLSNFSGLSLAQLNTQTVAQEILDAHDDWKIGVILHKNEISTAVMMVTQTGGSKDFGTLYLDKDDEIGIVITNVKDGALGTLPSEEWLFESVVVTIEKID